MWNCQGVGSPLTVPQLEEVVKLHSLQLIFLSETKNKKSYLNTVKMKLKFDKLFVIDPIEKSEGLAIMWRMELGVKKVLFIDLQLKR